MRHNTNRVGVYAALASYGMWGVFPLFWRLLADVPALELVCHRILWSTALLGIAIPLLRRFGGIAGDEMAGSRAPVAEIDRAALPLGWSTGVLTNAALAASVISINWLSFIWAVGQDRVVEASLGYYISPLFSVALGVAVLSERLGRWQWGAILLASTGVLVIASSTGTIPWISLTLASSFAFYGLIKKNSQVTPLVGLLLENVLLLIPACGYLAWLCYRGVGTMGPSAPGATNMLLVMGGVVTVPPLMFFALAARRVALSTIGMLQYISPTLQFLCGTQVVGERLAGGGWLGFLCVWAACGLYIVGSRKAMRAKPILSSAPAAASVPSPTDR